MAKAACWTTTDAEARKRGEHYMETALEDRAGYIFKPVKIGKYTFVGGGSCIMPGVTVGKCNINEIPLQTSLQQQTI